MAKRIRVKYVGTIHSRESKMKHIPEGTEFKGVEELGTGGKLIGVEIRGSSLTKAAQGKTKFPCKVYSFLLCSTLTNNAMEVVTTKELS